jgi:hypothetical protein
MVLAGGAFCGLEQHDAGGNLSGYEVGCVDLYANTMTGDLGGSFLRVQAYGPTNSIRRKTCSTG